jgi:hypothetical protein
VSVIQVKNNMQLSGTETSIVFKRHELSSREQVTQLGWVQDSSRLGFQRDTKLVTIYYNYVSQNNDLLYRYNKIRNKIFYWNNHLKIFVCKKIKFFFARTSPCHSYFLKFKENLKTVIPDESKQTCNNLVSSSVSNFNVHL